jgi:hypothetical protein
MAPKSAQQMKPKNSPKPVVFSAVRQEESADLFDIFFPTGYARAGYLNFPDTNGKTGKSVRWMKDSDVIAVSDWNGGLLVRISAFLSATDGRYRRRADIADRDGVLAVGGSHGQCGRAG